MEKEITADLERERLQFKRLQLKRLRFKTQSRPNASYCFLSFSTLSIVFRPSQR